MRVPEAAVGCGCKQKRSAQTPSLPFEGEKAAAAIRVLREQGCTCPLVYSAPLDAAVVYGIPRTRYSTCPFHRRVPGALR